MRKKNLRHVAILCSISLIGLIGGTTSNATLMSALSLSNIVEHSTFIVEGHVRRIHSGVPINQQNTIVSYITINFAPKGILKNDVEANARARREENVITLKLLGGTANVMTAEGKVKKRTLVVLGNPGFKVDEDVLLFVRPGTGEMFGGFFRLVGMAQGKYRVEGGVATRRTDNIA